MKLLMASIALVFSYEALAVPSDVFVNQFKDYVGHYKVVGCANIIVTDPTKPPETNAHCDLTDASIYFGSNYHPTPDFDGLYLDMNKPDNPKYGVGTGLADGIPDSGETCTTAPGMQLCNNFDLHYQQVVTLSKTPDGIVHVHWTLTWPEQSGRGGLINDLYVDLKP